MRPAGKCAVTGAHPSAMIDGSVIAGGVSTMMLTLPVRLFAHTSVTVTIKFLLDVAGTLKGPFPVAGS